MDGKLHVYTGDGKGKTTAALGLTLRAVGAGLSVYIGQFLKGSSYSELSSIKRLGDAVLLEQFGQPSFVRDKPTEADIAAARRGLGRCAEMLTASTFDIVVLDEANLAVHYDMFSIDELLEVLAHRAPTVEAIVTGRRAHPRLLEAADLVTEMREVKHYFHTGVMARQGIED